MIKLKLLFCLGLIITTTIIQPTKGNCSPPKSGMNLIGNKFYYMDESKSINIYPSDLNDEECQDNNLILGKLETLEDFQSMVSFLNQENEDDAYVNIYLYNGDSCSSYSGCVLRDKDEKTIDLSFINTGASPSISTGTYNCAKLSKNGVLFRSGCSGNIFSGTPVICEHACPVNGNWVNWTPWTSCSSTCGSSSKTRTRTCTNPAPGHGGSDCPGLGTETSSCSVPICPIHGAWSLWSFWNICPVTCGGSNQTRSRTCNDPAPQHGGNSCPGDSQDFQECSTNPCPINGEWSTWSEWTTCSKTCSNGTQSRSRACNSPSPQHGGSDCLGDNQENRACFVVECPIDGQWSSWTSWSSCSTTCDQGEKIRTRNCDNPLPQFGGANCVGSPNETNFCTIIFCPINGGWSEWNSWSYCSVSCGGGIKERNKDCSNPEPQYGGLNCTGDRIDYLGCGMESCPIHGRWSLWTSWSSCSNTCGGGSRERNRLCNNPEPLHGGNLCLGDFNNSQPCNTQPCPINGAWTTWSQWSGCVDMRKEDIRTRSCTNPLPQHGGINCLGSDKEIQRSCPPVWSDWSLWSSCSRTCGYGSIIRSRFCSHQSGCLGNDEEMKYCLNLPQCPPNNAKNGLKMTEMSLKISLKPNYINNAIKTTTIRLNNVAQIATCAIHCRKLRENISEFTACNSFAIIDDLCYLGFLSLNDILNNNDPSSDFKLYIDFSV